MDLSRLKVTALDNNKNSIEKITITFKESNLTGITLKNLPPPYTLTVVWIILYKIIQICQTRIRIPLQLRTLWPVGQTP